ncbi:MAG TPA: bifunctional nuclease family protein [Pseudonocardia sp.]|jgi:hypothetical protein|nr:bifunctional nuclease family protein [Pseudonocardia sp.]
MRVMRVVRLVIHARSHQPVLLLIEVGGTRCLPVFLRQPQAQVIALGERGPSDPLLTQDLLVPVVHALGRRLERIELTNLRDGVFSAELVFDTDIRIQARPSDALCLAVRDGLPITVADAVLDEAGRPADEVLSSREQLREFREFLDNVSPEDF